MSRRAPNPAAERAAQNTQTIKNLLKLEGNKTCADCKRNKHPRWASWNLGIFVCIRCSGIHRGMGTHISRVKSVDLDAWTDEQLQSVLKWGNSRANKYWEAKLAPGHVPSEAKIENFIRTKYESKRWVMDGPIPDPSTLDAEGDDDVPLSLVKEKHAIERSASTRASSGPSGPSQIRREPQPDLFAEDIAPPRANSAAPARPRPGPPPKSEPAPPKQTKPADSLLGLDFFGTEAPPPNRPSSAAATAAAPGAQSRPDLKQSILSLYASAPRPQPQQQPSHGSSGSFGGMQPPMQQSPPPQQTNFGGMNDAFSNLSFSNPSSPGVQAQPQPSAFSSLGNITNHQRAPSQASTPGTLTGGSFFDTKPVSKPPQQPSQPSRTLSSSSGFGAFDSAPGMSSGAQGAVSASSGLGDLFDFSEPASQPAAPKPATAAPTSTQPSVFNLSQPVPQPAPQPQAAMAPMSGWSNNDAWGSNDAWSGTNTSPTVTKVATPLASPNSFNWGSGGASLANQSIVPGGGGGFNPASTGPPKVSVDEDFGGWSSAAPVTPGVGATAAKPAPGFAASEDLFSNVWE
ncbi:ArfGap-domain-containing protein [Venustampulla echinocandica]|uniref:ArfGap-domain-containing protein n=1 Tax=Venustampulla echinocandica TaxID=2656787 RepID=A0A370TNE4_9HELO|nr:ArfGap-domain-containing protein [Venustampulla echinocandica]RDL37045.1 ArfGap-domain-containing protein [Venustampulla echinocandica]